AAAVLLAGCSNGEQNVGASTAAATAAASENTQVETVLNSVSEEKIMDSLNNGIIIDEVSGNVYKKELNANPISSSVFCADPTAVEYNGRLYVYGTNDAQQAEQSEKNDYDKIKTLVIFSTDDMVNWIYHGKIETGEIAPWIYNSWAPSIASRVEDDGLTHFYLYFSNSGNGVGVITSTDPVGPWSDPLGKPLVYQDMPGLENCPAPFDPGVCIDDNGTGWLTFGGGAPASGGEIHTNIPKIVKLGADMLSFDSEFVSIDAPYFFEASELNYIDGTYYYTYCNDWQQRGSEWDYNGIPTPPSCSMAYLTTKTPLDADSWEYRGAYFYNSGQNADGESGLRWGNNHTHFCEYQGTDYILHHTLLLEESSGGTGGFRSLMVDYLPMDKTSGEIPITAASRRGVSQIKLLDPYSENSGALMFTSANIGYTEGTDPSSKSIEKGSWIYVRGADFGYGASEFTAKVKGNGRIEVRLDDISNEAAAFIEFDCDEYTNIRSSGFSNFEGRNHNIYFVFSDKDIELASWQFTKGEDKLRPEENISETEIEYETLVISAQAENPGPSPSAVLEMTSNGDYSVKSASFAKESEVLNLGFINTDENAKYMVYVKSLALETENGIVEIPVEVELDPKSNTDNGLANGWGGAELGSVIYGSEKCGLVAAETSIDWIGYRIALIEDGNEIPYTSITYNITVSGL
ncbi:MAG: glycoside hydrolase family 43 protein, partial [Oscillospiraceae bacterium]|nr:glycoside hydrolase family 43 protein [Oscillospiraceae bacterium]